MNESMTIIFLNTQINIRVLNDVFGYYIHPNTRNYTHFILTLSFGDVIKLGFIKNQHELLEFMTFNSCIHFDNANYYQQLIALDLTPHAAFKAYFIQASSFV